MASSAPPAGRPPRQASGRSCPAHRATGAAGAAVTACCRAIDIGIQLFTVRDQVASLGFEAVFAA